MVVAEEDEFEFATWTSCEGEQCEEEDGSYADKSLLAWRVEDLRFQPA